VLVLADAQGARLDLDQLGQGVLQAAGDRDGAAQGDVELRQLLAGDR
jgi:hypothetical protein